MASLPYSIEALLLETKRSFGEGAIQTAIIPDVVISEHHVDTVSLTRHPVDTGAEVSDHAYKMPAVINCQFGWSNSSRLLNSAITGSNLKALENIQDVYQRLLELMEMRMPFRLSTGKRVYESVIITNLQTTTTVDTESSLIVDITFEEVFRAEALETTLGEIRNRNGGRTDVRNNVGQVNASKPAIDPRGSLVPS